MEIFEIYNYLINQQRINKDGISYYLINSKNREIDTYTIATILSKLSKSLLNLIPSLTEAQVKDIIFNNIDKLEAIRIDETDRNIGPMRVMLDEFTRGGKIPFLDKKNDGVTSRVKYDGVMMLVPDLVNADREIDGVHTFLHEFMHVLSIWDDKSNNPLYNIGIWDGKNRYMFEAINEGLNEYFTRKVMKEMYPDQQIDESRYNERINVVESLMGCMPDSDKFLLDYISGDGVAMLNKLHSTKTPSGESLYDILDSYEDKGITISGRNSAEDRVISEQIVKELQGENVEEKSNEFLHIAK